MENGGQSVGVALTAVGWTFAGCFGIAAFVLGILTAVGAGPLGLSQQDFMSPADSDGRILPRNARLPLYGHRGHEKLAYFSRLRKLPRAANDWTCGTCPRWPQGN